MPEYLPSFPLLWAQAANIPPTRVGVAAVPVFVLLSVLVLGVLAIVFGPRHSRYKREAAHLERMKALELGLLPTTTPPGAALVCAAIGAGVPVAACLFAMITSLGTHDREVASTAWPAAFLISLAALYFAYRLANRLFFMNATTHSDVGEIHASYPKTISDPDLYDVVSRRG